MKAKHLLIALLLTLTTSTLLAQTNNDIAYIETKSGYHKVFNSKGQQITLKYAQTCGDILGYSNSLIITIKNGYYYTYDYKFQQIAMKYAQTTGDFVSIAGNNISFMRNRYLTTYDTKFKQLSQRYVSH